MKTIYLDCGMGAAGDMLTAALIELLPNPDEMLKRLNELPLPGIVFQREKIERSGITGTHMHVFVNGEEEGVGAEHAHGHAHEHAHGHEHSHASLGDITDLINGLPISGQVKKDAVAVFNMLAQAESTVHGRPVTDIHFHEVGTMDAVADITAVCMIMEALAPDAVYASPVHVGSGHVRCAHGLLPVPAPATAEILKGIPIYGGSIQGELCTPTGAALLKHFVKSFGDMPQISIEKTGYGMGTKEFGPLNCVRAFLGTAADKKDTICHLSCNVDDMTAEEIAFAAETILSAGARDVYTVPLGMKKNRPGTMICVICDVDRSNEMAALMFKHTSTVGIRRILTGRYVLDRRETIADTKYGPVRIKHSQGYGTEREKMEYEDLARIAREQGRSIVEIRRELGSEG